MSLDANGVAALALHRFGLGPRAGSIAAIASDPRGALLAELDRPGPAQIVDADLMTSRASRRAVLQFPPGTAGAPDRAEARPRRSERLAGEAMDAHGRSRRGRPTAAPPEARCRSRIFFREAKARIDAALRCRHRLRRAAGLVLVEPFLRLRRRACRAWPEATSARRSARMCSAASPTCCSPPRAIRRCCSISTTHARSGPNSVAGLHRTTRALTRTSRARSSSCIRSASAAVYTQDDVTSFAKVITGWTIIPSRRQSGPWQRIRVQSAHA